MLSIKKSMDNLRELANQPNVTEETNESIQIVLGELERVRKPKSVLTDGTNVLCPHCEALLWETISSQKPFCPDCGGKITWRYKKINRSN